MNDGCCFFFFRKDRGIKIVADGKEGNGDLRALRRKIKILKIIKENKLAKKGKGNKRLRGRERIK